MSTKLFLIAILSGLITTSGLLGYGFLTQNIGSAVIGIGGLVLLIAFFQAMTLFVSRRIGVSLNYGSSFLAVITSSAVMVPLYFYVVLMDEPIDIDIVIAGVIFFLVNIAIGAIVSIFFRRSKGTATINSGQLDDPNF